MAEIAFIGTGVMGAPMAGHLVTAGHNVTVYNRSPEKAAAWTARHGGRSAATALEAIAGAEVLVTCVGNDADLDALLLQSPEAMEQLRGGLIIDHTTVSARISRNICDAAAAFEIEFVDAPVSGGQAGAEKGALSIMCGARSPQVFARAEVIVAAYAARTIHVGGPGAGQQTKMVNQIAIAGVLQGLSEALRFAQASDLDTAKVFEAISGGAAQSWQMVNRWQSMSEDRFDFGFAVDWMRKDLGLALDEAKRNGAVLPVAALVDQFYAEVQKLGGARQDTSSLVRRLPK
ncbi:NAD(P)-dependent oxidoreductase [Sphingomonas alpina]|uniref:NAD(P)-dependent oxidoreductase n=1 Tax=Sphingomonas alpina TaxID=653931 RepID=A0A7H0LPT0_9SPHN|nr:NAD(P)-dependent oxidoreductase [Sphingomonas alpina]QNQ11683.1 NAD(P)-dependent oxidoreductase [Sphingomonas alpina]